MLLDELILFGRFEILTHHLRNEFLETDLWHPAELLPGLRRIAEQSLHLGGPEVPGLGEAANS